MGDDSLIEGPTFNGVIAAISVLHLLLVVVDLFIVTLACECTAGEVRSFRDAGRNATMLFTCADRLLDGTLSTYACLSVMFVSWFELRFIIIDTVFLSVYVVETTARVIIRGLGVFWDPLNVLDVFIIVSGLTMNVSYLMADHYNVGSFPLLRLARVFRVIRVVNMLSFSPLRFIKRMGLQSGLLASRLRIQATGRQPTLALADGKRWHLFLSHHWNNQDVVGTLKQQLLLMLPGANIFRDVDNLKSLDALEGEVAASQAMLVLLGSPAYFASPNCRREVAAAMSHKVPLILVHDSDEGKGGAKLETLEICCPKDAIFDEGGSSHSSPALALDDILFPPASGRTWEWIGETRPSTGTELANMELAVALVKKADASPTFFGAGSTARLVGGGLSDKVKLVTFSEEEWERFGVLDVSFDHFVAAPDGNTYFRPALAWREQGGAMRTSPIPWQRTLPALRDRTLLLIAEHVLQACPEHWWKPGVPLTILDEHAGLQLEPRVQLRFSEHNLRTSGLRWERVPVSEDGDASSIATGGKGMKMDARSARGTRVANEALAAALARKTTFAQEEFDRFQVQGDLRADHFVLSGGTCYRPVGGAEAVARSIEKAVSAPSVGSQSLRVESSSKASRSDTPFLLYLSKFTFKDWHTPGSDGHRLAEEVRQEWEAGSPIVLVHEQDVDVGGCNFDILLRVRRPHTNACRLLPAPRLALTRAHKHTHSRTPLITSSFASPSLAPNPLCKDHPHQASARRLVQDHRDPVAPRALSLCLRPARDSCPRRQGWPRAMLCRSQRSTHRSGTAAHVDTWRTQDHGAPRLPEPDG